MNVLVTGSSGYIGCRLVDALARQGHVVFGIDRDPPVPGAPLARVVQADLLDLDATRASLEGADVVMHLAAAKGDWGISDTEYYRDNVEATEALLQAGRERGVRDWIFYSSVSAHGPSRVPLSEEQGLAPVNAYGKTKLQGERLFSAYARAHPGTRLGVLRPSVVFGPENPSNTNIYRLIDALDRGRFVMVGKGEAYKTTSYIDNVVAATLFLAERLDLGATAPSTAASGAAAPRATKTQTYIYVDEPTLSTGELVTAICRLLGRRPPSFHVPLRLAYPLALVADALAALLRVDLPITAARIKKFCTSTYFDASAIRRDGFVQPVSMQEALAATVAWHVEQASSGHDSRAEGASRAGHGVEARRRSAEPPAAASPPHPTATTP